MDKQGKLNKKKKSSAKLTTTTNNNNNAKGKQVETTSTNGTPSPRSTTTPTPSPPTTPTQPQQTQPNYVDAQVQQQDPQSPPQQQPQTQSPPAPPPQQQQAPPELHQQLADTLNPTLLPNGAHNKSNNDDDDDDDTNHTSTQQQLLNTAELEATGRSLLHSPSTEDLMLEHPSAFGSASAATKRRTNLKQDDGLVTMALKWESGGHNVSVVFSTDWNSPQPMKRLADGTFEFRGRFTPFQLVVFKFVVDRAWVTSSSYGLIEAQDNTTNNFFVPVDISWRSNARSAFVCFAFDDWATKHRLRCEMGTWVIRKPMTHRGDYIFKFIIDDVLTTSPDYETTYDDNNIARLLQPEGEYLSQQPHQENYAHESPIATHEHDDSDDYHNVHSNPTASSFFGHSTNANLRSDQWEVEPEDPFEHSAPATHQTVHHEESHVVPDPYSIPIHYMGEASHVELRHSGDDWQEAHVMTKLQPGLFVWHADLAPFAPVEFKFVVDGTWTTSADYDTTTETENRPVNNIAMPVRFVYHTQGACDAKVHVVCDVDDWKTRREMCLVSYGGASSSTAKGCSSNDGSEFVWSGFMPVAESYKFKFVVGDEWCLSNEYNTQGEGVFTNNIIEL